MQTTKIGRIRLEHLKSSAVDEFRFVAWGIGFITPKGSPVNEPKEKGVGQNEFCYNDQTKKCRIDLCVGVLPSVIDLPIPPSYIKDMYSGVKDSGYDAHSDWAWPGCNTRRVYGPKECEFGFDANGSRVEEEAYGN